MPSPVDRGAAGWSLHEAVRKVPVGGAPVRTENDVAVRYRTNGGGFVDTPLDRLPVDDVLAGLPVREFRSLRGRKHYENPNDGD